MNYKDYYKLLGVSKNASQKDIKKAYRKLAAKYHPDKTKGDAKAEEKFKEINEANEVISDPEKRKKYDELGANWQSYQQGGGDRAYRGGRRGGQTYQFEGDPSEFFGRGSEDSGFSSFFDMFFGGGATGQSGSAGQQYTQRTRQGRDVEAELPVTLLEAYQGSKRVFEIFGQKLRITIKPGSYDGQRLRLKGKGQPLYEGGVRGDLYIMLNISPDPRFTRKGDDLIYKADVDLYTAILGGRIEIPTMGDKVKLRIPQGVQNGKILRLKGKGMPIYKNKDEFGNLLVKLNIIIPTRISEEERSLFEKLQNLSQVEKVKMN